MKRLSLILLILAFTLQLTAEEGMIPITGMTPAVFQRMQQLGFQLKPEDIWDGRGNGLALAVVNLGATESFVSENGLILTNHHVAFGAVQRQATPDHNYIRGKNEYSFYIDRELRDVPVNFITSNDSTGGNSGSPVLNGRGELVGILFDGNYEALSSDFQYDPAITRFIHVDIRYVLFISDKLSRAVTPT